ncbi:MAG: class IV adenylate cyclase [Chloroflexi bacterium]|nr:class IV adenylate cyclase [Chloroflexota bacterium]
MGSKLEQEVKFYLNDLAALEKGLIELGATQEQPRTHEINLRFDTPDRRLSEKFQVLRLRQDKRARLTFKGPNNPEQEVSAREELEIDVSDLRTTQAILESLGFEVMVMYEKFRAAYLLEGVEISLDEMPFGTFCEVEGPDTESIQKAAVKLGLDWEARGKLSYLALFSMIKEKLNLEMNNLDFNSFIGLEIHPDDFGMKPADQSFDYPP